MIRYVMCVFLFVVGCASQSSAPPDPKMMELLIALTSEEEPKIHTRSALKRKEKRMEARLKNYNDLLSYPIYFELESSILKMEALDNISKKVRLIEKTDYNITVNGYAFVENKGFISKEASYLLSKSRAKVVRDELVKRNIQPNRISSIGHGNIPAYSYEKYRGRNERVVITLSPKHINLSTGDF